MNKFILYSPVPTEYKVRFYKDVKNSPCMYSKINSATSTKVGRNIYFVDIDSNTVGRIHCPVSEDHADAEKEVTLYTEPMTFTVNEGFHLQIYAPSGFKMYKRIATSETDSKK